MDCRVAASAARLDGAPVPYPVVLIVIAAFHGLLDLAHARLVQNAGVPASWPVFYAVYDVSAAP